jgi:hypothetical protein
MHPSAPVPRRSPLPPACTVNQQRNEEVPFEQRVEEVSEIALVLARIMPIQFLNKSLEKRIHKEGPA